MGEPPPLLIPKSDGWARFCIDFRKLNDASTFDVYSMPRVDMLIDRVGEAQVLFTIDLFKRYWQIPLTKHTQEKTAFATPSGLNHFLKMPLGLHGAAASFQRVVDRVLKDVHDCAVTYIDDILIFSLPWDRHLRCILNALRLLA